MSLTIHNELFVFCLLFGLMLLLSIVMTILGSEFYTKDVVIRKFSIFDIELAANPLELANIIKGVYMLPPSQSGKTLKAIRGQLFFDFLAMPCAYGSVFLLCKKVAERMDTPLAQQAFMILAWLQLVAWLFDIVENIYLLVKINPDPIMPSRPIYTLYLMMEVVKWGIVLVGVACSVSAICYFWLSGHYSPGSVPYIIIVIVEVILFLAVLIFIPKKNILDENQ
ncbi:hypothetical protein [Segetibacter koreensis]|uniref:hypothetical protein n=1 Tax=Segetibacter koreensis TaxID=398037 RepID=UPI0003755D82|nr:hypothetical protein [Segetibacter koreensis]